MLNDLYFKTTCHIRPHLLGPMGGLKIEGPMYRDVTKYVWLQKFPEKKYYMKSQKDSQTTTVCIVTEISRKKNVAFSCWGDLQWKRIMHACGGTW